MNYDVMVKYLLDIPKFGVKAGLDNIKTLMDRLGNPEDKLKVIHVAGTNGKGSVCTMLSYILTEQGYTTGLFTSPHLIHINERFKINNHDISNDELIEVFMIVKNEIDKMVNQGHNHPTFFEVMVALAFVYFNRNKVDYVVLETGLGGRLDSTNIIKAPLVSVITAIGFDHIDVLGNTIEEITKEKAGIIKAGSPTVLYYEFDSVYRIVKDVCINKESKLYSFKEIDYKISNRNKNNIDFSINNKYYNYEKVYLNVTPTYQVINASITLTVIEAIRDEGVIVTKDNVTNGLAKFKWPGRMEYIAHNMIVDGAHNLEGIETLIHELNQLNVDHPINLLFACMKDKPYEEMIKGLILCSNVNHIIVTQLDSDRAVDVNTLESIFLEKGFSNITKFTDIEEALTYGRELARQEQTVCCLGSLYLVGYIKNIIKGGS